jgi:predicted permease
MRFEIIAEGKPLVPGEAVPRAEFRSANPEYFRASGIPLLAGREFVATDDASAAKVLIVNKTFADKFFPNEDPVGKRVAFTGEILKFTPFTGAWRTIVGVVGNTQDGGLDTKPRMAVFTPFVQEIALQGGFAIRTDSNAKALVAPVTQIIRRLAPAVPIENVLTVKQIKDQSVSPRRLNAVLLSSLGALALIIAAVGIAGVLAFSVSARTNEIGIRMSLGADRAQVQWMVLKEGGVLLAAGLALGVGGALAGAGVIRGLLFGVAPHDPVTFIGVSLMMAVIGIGACWIPAIRASRVDPAIAMRA